MTRKDGKELPILSINLIHHKTMGSKIPMGSIEFDMDTQMPDNGKTNMNHTYIHTHIHIHTYIFIFIE